MIKKKGVTSKQASNELKVTSNVQKEASRK